MAARRALSATHVHSRDAVSLARHQFERAQCQRPLRPVSLPGDLQEIRGGGHSLYQLSVRGHWHPCGADRFLRPGLYPKQLLFFQIDQLPGQGTGGRLPARLYPGRTRRAGHLLGCFACAVARLCPTGRAGVLCRCNLPGRRARAATASLCPVQTDDD